MSDPEESVVPGLNGNLHNRTANALTFAVLGGYIAGVVGVEIHVAAGIAVVALVGYAAFAYVPPAETVATKWCEAERENKGGSA